MLRATSGRGGCWVQAVPHRMLEGISCCCLPCLHLPQRTGTTSMGWLVTCGMGLLEAVGVAAGVTAHPQTKKQRSEMPCALVWFKMLWDMLLQCSNCFSLREWRKPILIKTPAALLSGSWFVSHKTPEGVKMSKNHHEVRSMLQLEAALGWEKVGSSFWMKSLDFALPKLLFSQNFAVTQSKASIINPGVPPNFLDLSG